jgi:tetratricopeptide (TPR) repeat protein
MKGRKQKQAQTTSGTGSKRKTAPSAVDDSINRAVELFKKGRNEQVLELLNSLSIEKLNGDWSKSPIYYRLMAFALINLGRFHEAEKNIDDGLQLVETDLDLLFVAIFVGVTLHDYEHAMEFGQKYLDQYQRLSATELKEYFSADRLSLAHNLLGVAARALHDFEKAAEYFNSAIKQDRTKSHPYINLANLYLQRKNYEKAEKIVADGLKHCSQIQELRILKEVLKNKATVSVCMIVKNEEELLSNCLESVRNWADEIIVVDTGSTDKTVAIAESYGAKVYHQSWAGDFSKPRNLSLEKATGDWIFIIDADEEFVAEDIAMLRQAMAQSKFRLVAINVYNMNRATGECTSFLPSYRLFRRDAGFYYDGIVHNQLKYGANEPALRVGARLKHYGYSLSPEKMKKKLERSRSLLEKQLQEQPNDSYVHFNYAQLLRGSGPELDSETTDLIIRHATKAVELSKDNLETQMNTHLMAHHQLITTYIYLKNYQEAERLCYQALALKADYLDPLLSLGQIYSHRRELEKAEKYYNKYLEIQADYNESEETTNFILLYLKARHIAYYGLAIIAHFKGDIAKAESYYKKVLTEYGPYSDTNIRLARIYMDRADLEGAWNILDRELSHNPDSAMGHLYMAEYLVRVHNIPAAEIHIRKALSNGSENREIIEKSGCFYANQGQVDMAIPIFEKLVSHNPDYSHGLRLLGKAYYDAGRYNKAQEIYQKYLQIENNDSEILNDLANCYFKSHDYHKAEIYYQRALALNQNLGVIYRNLGLTKMQLGRAEEALTLLERYIEISPDDIDIEMALGTIFRQIGRYTEAIPHYEKYLIGNVNNIEALFGISECYYNLGHIESALIGYRQVLKLSPDHPGANSRLKEVTRHPAIA